MKDNSVLFLFDYAPLIQLWAGICLLFFYEKLLLENNPFEKSKSICIGKIRETHERLRRMAIGRFQSYFINNETDDLEVPPSLPLREIDFKKDEYWKTFRKYIYNTAIISFFYAVIILLYAGAEKMPYLIEQNFYKVFIVINTAVIIYFLAFSLVYKRRFAKKLWIHVLFLIGIIIYIHFHLTFRNFLHTIWNDVEFLSWSRKAVTIYTLVTCLSGMLSIVGNIYLARIDTWQKKLTADRIGENSSQLMSLPLTWGKIRKKHSFIFFRIMNKISKEISRNENESWLKYCANRLLTLMLLLVFLRDSKAMDNEKERFGNYRNNIYESCDSYTAEMLEKAMTRLRKAYHGFVCDPVTDM